MLSLHNGKKSAPVSTHGKALLMELLTPASANLEVALSFIEKDPMAGRLKDPETGNNSYHLLLGNDHSSEFVITVLKALIEKCPEGVRAVNNKGSLPLHMCLSQQDIVFEAAGMLLKTYPGAAGHANNQVLSNTSYPVRSNILFAYSFPKLNHFQLFQNQFEFNLFLPATPHRDVS